MITATEYYIDHFGEEAFVAAPKDNSAYVTKAELEELKQQMIDAAVMAAKDEKRRTGDIGSDGSATDGENRAG